MRQQDYLSDLWTTFPDILDNVQEDVKNQFIASVTREALPAVARYAVRHLGARFVISVATDMREKSGDFRVSYVLAFDGQKKFLVLQADVPADDPTITSITPDVPAANWSEREARDMVGIVPNGHPDPRRLILPDDFPEDVHPLRREYEYNTIFPKEPQNAPAHLEAPDGATVIPLGPFYPTATPVRMPSSTCNAPRS